MKYREYTFKRSSEHTIVQQERITRYNATQRGPKFNQKKKEGILFESSPHAQKAAPCEPRTTGHAAYSMQAH